MLTIGESVESESAESEKAKMLEYVFPCPFKLPSSIEAWQFVYRHSRHLEEALVRIYDWERGAYRIYKGYMK